MNPFTALTETLGITDVRWFNDEQVRDARARYQEAHRTLNDYSDHHYETHPRNSYDTPEYDKLNATAYDAWLDLRDARP